ncbi:hypothetical protein GT354_21295, partial [Streptomyces sp. SID3343]|nr:hypothetical protein [Streptomyces sp. SID3343]
RTTTSGAKSPRAPRTLAPAPAPLLGTLPTNACDGLAAGGVFPVGGATHRWCHAQERLR